ncbi:hypothetical protein T12_845 [Trichinella patagoniensis]|uniref:Uncharacterized protein n=1 Tax=Trichinella patagoniensis TaxID=990121 RepID=A0A0V0ZKN7_9BILA|nr:hypothetical protein T12_845 [Trichinella patagoniensis]
MDVENSEKTNPNYGRPDQFPFQRGHIDDEQNMNGSSRFGVHFPTASILSFFLSKSIDSPRSSTVTAARQHRSKWKKFRIEPTNQRWPSVLVPFQSSPARRCVMSILSASSSCVHLLPSGEGSLASLVSEWASEIRLYSPLLAAVLLHPYCGIFSPFLSNRGQRSRRSPPNLACHSTRRRYELRSTQIDMLKSMPDMIVKLRFSWWIMQIRSSHCQCRSNDFADRSADPIRSDPIVRFISIVLLGLQVQMVQLGKWRSVESESARSAAGRVECVKAAPLLRAVHLL